MRSRYAAAFALAAAAGTGLHFLYPLLPIPLVALFAPVSESVWEHLKLLYWPFLVAAAALARRERHRLRGLLQLLRELRIRQTLPREPLRVQRAPKL